MTIESHDYLTNKFSELETKGILSKSGWTLEGSLVQIQTKSVVLGEGHTELTVKFLRIPTNGGGQKLPQPSTPSLLLTVVTQNMGHQINSWVIGYNNNNSKYTEKEIIEKVGSIYDYLNNSIGRTQLKPIGI